MSSMICNPLFYILIVNIIGLIWAVRSWKKNIREKWMNNLRDAGSELIGAAENIYLQNVMNKNPKELAGAMSSFITKEQKVLLLFAESSKTQVKFKEKAKQLKEAADKADIESYNAKKKEFSSLIAERVMKEWDDIKGFF